MTKYKFTDLTQRDIELLKICYSANDGFFTCFGASTYAKFRELQLITEDNKIAWNGKQLVKYLGRTK